MDKTPPRTSFLSSIAQGLKSSAVWWRQADTDDLIASSVERVQNLDDTYGLPHGMFCADELLCEDEEKQMPSRGTELCAVVEAMFSYETMFSIHGFVVFADKVEQIAFNAMPATWASPKGRIGEHMFVSLVSLLLLFISNQLICFCLSFFTRLIRQAVTCGTTNTYRP